MARTQGKGTDLAHERLVTADESGSVVLRRHGDAHRALRAGRRIDAVYRTPLAAHAHLEPLAALAEVRDGRAEVWVSTQYPERVAQQVRAALGGELEVVVHPTHLGGFGRKTSQSAAPGAARLSRAVGRPVHVGWTREEDLAHGFYRPPTHTVLRGSVDARGRILGVEQLSASADILWGVETVPGGETTLGALGFDPGVLIGQFLPYSVPNYRVLNRRMRLPILTGPWRGLGLLPNVFALESFMDELAHAARLRRVLRSAAQRARWEAGAAPGRALGLACCVDLNTAVAMVAEVSVSRGEIRVHRVTVTVDPGLVVNPQGATLQAQGSVVMGLGSALREEMTISDGLVQELNFDAYPLLTLAETPDIEVTMLESGETPYGMGEPVIGPVPAAVANAVFALTGERLRRLPLRL